MFEGMPYTNFHELNTDWIIKIAKDFLDQYTNIQQTITQGLEDLDTKAQQLEALLDAWYDQHSEDIAQQLADALEDLNAWYTLHQNYLDQTLTDKIAAFNTAADAKAAETIASIPADYTTVANNVIDLQTINAIILDDSVFTVTGKYLAGDNLVDNENFATSDAINISGNNILVLYKTSQQTGGLTFAFYTTSDISSYIAGKLVSELDGKEIYCIPASANYIRVCKRNTGAFLGQISFNSKETIESIYKNINVDKELLIIDENGYVTDNNRITPFTNNYNNCLVFNRMGEFIYDFSFETIWSSTKSPRLFLFSRNDAYYVVFANENGYGKINLYKITDDTVSYISTITNLNYPNGNAKIRFKMIGNIWIIYVNGEMLTNIEALSVAQKIYSVGVGFVKAAGNPNYYKNMQINYSLPLYAHLSLDDQITALQDLTTNKDIYSSIFDNTLFANIKELHDKYGCTFTLNLFYELNGFSLSSVTDKFKTEFRLNSWWLKFAYHADGPEDHPAERTTESLISSVNTMYTQIARFAGVETIDKVTRIAFYSLTKAQAIALRTNNLMFGFLTADDTRADNTGLNATELRFMQMIDVYTDLTNKITYYRTSPRLDVNTYATRESMMAAFNSAYDQLGNQNIIEVFAHDLTGEEIKARFEMICQWIAEHGIRYDFSINHLMY